MSISITLIIMFKSPMLNGSLISYDKGNPLSGISVIESCPYLSSVRSLMVRIKLFQAQKSPSWAKAGMTMEYRLMRYQ